MKNSYFIALAIVLVAIIGFMISSKKTEAPIKENIKVEDNSLGTILDGEYKLDTSSSTIYWEGEYLSGLKEGGTVKLSSGSIKVQDGQIMEGVFTVDMNTIDSVPHKDMLVNHLKSDDFFGVEVYPTAEFKLKKMVSSSDEGARSGRFVFAGDLSVRGITKPISFTATLSNNASNELSAKASFAINRADWEIKYNSPTFFRNLGDKIIRDAVLIELDLKAQRVIQ